VHKTTNGATPASTKLRAYQDIRRKIVRLELSPGQDLDEARLVETYGLSRTPIRELLIRLAGEGLVVLRRNRGAYVSPLSVDTLQAVFEAGDLLERAIIRLACARRDERDGDLGEQAAMEHADFCKDGIRDFLASGGDILREVVLEARPL